MTAKWKQIESYKEAIKLREGKFVMTPDQAQMILDLKKKELQKSKYLSIVDISSAEVKKLAKKDKSIEKVIGKLGGSFRVNLLKSKADSKSGAVGGYRQMKSRTPAQLRALRKQMGIKNWDEDAPTVHTGPAIAGTGDDSSTVVVKKKKKLYDGRTKEARKFMERMLSLRAKRESKLAKKVQENTENFGVECLIEANVDILRKIVKNKQNMPVKMKDGKMKVDLFTASAITQALDKVKPDTRKKMEDIINNGGKAQFLKLVNVVFK